MRWPLILGYLFSLVPTLYGHPLENWYLRSETDTSYVFQDIIFDGDSFVAVGTIGSINNSTVGFIQTSETGINWTNFPAPPLLSITYGHSNFLAVGKTGIVMRSSDAFNWTTENSGTTNHLTQIAFGNNAFVAIGGTNLVLTSTNGADWTSQTLPVTQVRHIVFGNGLFLLRTSPTDNYISTNGIAWTPVGVPTNNGVNAIEFAADEFVSVCANLQVFSSTDGVSWRFRGTNRLFRTSGLAQGHGFYVLASGGSAIEYSSDLNNWKVVFGSTATVYKAAFGRGTFVVAGSGRVYQSDPIVNLKMLAPDQLFIETPVPTSLQIQSDPAFDWQIVTNLTITNSPYVWTNINPSTQNHGFYRVSVAP